MLPTVLRLASGDSCNEAGIADRPPSFTMPARSTCAASIFSPTSFESFTKDYRSCIHDDEEDQEHDDGSRGLLDEPALRAVRPEENLDRQGSRRVSDAFGDVDDERDHADHE